MSYDRFGKGNSNWKGERAGKRAKHYRVSNKRGKPTRCDVCGSKDSGKHYEWAKIGRNKYKRMCRGCHNTYDGKIRNITKSMVHA